MSINDDFRKVASKTTGIHRGLRFSPDLWIKNQKFDIGVVYDSKIPVVAYALKYDFPCPISPDHDTRIQYFVFDFTKGYDYIEKYFARAFYQMETQMGVKTKFWGAVPKYLPHLVKLLDKVSKANNCERIDGVELSSIYDLPDYDHHFIYIGTTTNGKKTMGDLR